MTERQGTSPIAEISAGALDGDDEPADHKCHGGRPQSQRDLTIWRIATAISVVPIIVSTVRAGATGWIPSGDAAATVVRSHYALSASPTLVGMYTDASGWVGTPTYFPGPWQLWWMSIPIRVLGSPWGSILAMALLNALWIVLTSWIVQRRFGTRTAIGVLGFLGLLTWSLGTEALYSPVPMVMIIPAFAALVFISWAVAAGDDTALGWFALLVSFCLLDHLVLTTLVPIIAGTAVLSWGVRVFQQRRAGTMSGHQRRSHLRGMRIAGAVAVLMWLPTFVQQITATPGNITNLIDAQTSRPDIPTMWARSLSVLVELFSPPRFWLSQSQSQIGASAKYQIAEPLGTMELALFIGVAGVVIGLLVVMFRRRDRGATTALIIAIAAFVAALVNQARPPSETMIRNSYYISNRVVAMFVTFAILYAVVRLLPRSQRRFVDFAAPGLVVVMAVANVSSTHQLPGTTQSSPAELRISRSLNDQLIPKLHGHRLVAISGDQSVGYPHALALAVALQDAGIPYCVDGIAQLAGAPVAGCPDTGSQVVLRFVPTLDWETTARDGNRIAKADALSGAERTELQALTKKVEESIVALDRSDRPLHFTPEAKASMRARDLDRGRLQKMLDEFNSPETLDGQNPTEPRLELLATTVRSVETGDTSPAFSVVRLPGLEPGDLTRWAALEHRRMQSSVTVLATTTG